MDAKYKPLDHLEDRIDHPIVYVRPVPRQELPDDIRAQVSRRDTLYAIHDASGERLALCKDRALAFAVARTNDLEPVSVH